MILQTSDRIRYHARAVEGGLLNLRWLRYMRRDGVIASMQQSGTHWIRFMLSLTLAKLYDIPSQFYIQDRSIVGKPIFRHIPQIVDTTMIPHYYLRSRILFRPLRVPRYLILVRDLRDSLVSHYEKQRSAYGVDFSTFLRGDVSRKRYNNDIWTRIRFLNGWGPVVERQPEHVAVLKYEDLVADTHGELARVCDHFGIEGVTADLIDEVVNASSKAEMAKLSDPSKTRRAVRADPRPAEEWFGPDDRQFFAELCRLYLKYTFGYRYW
jgi:hypothetical protein